MFLYSFSNTFELVICSMWICDIHTMLFAASPFRFISQHLDDAIWIVSRDGAVLKFNLITSTLAQYIIYIPSGVEVLPDIMGRGGLGGWVGGGDDDVPCTCTHVWCYASDGVVGGVGMMTFLALAHMCDATHMTKSFWISSIALPIVEAVRLWRLPLHYIKLMYIYIIIYIYNNQQQGLLHNHQVPHQNVHDDS